MSTREIHDGTSLRRGVVNPNDSSARIVYIVDGLADTADQLDAANSAVVSAVGTAHPDDSDMTLRTVTAQWFRGADTGSNGAAIVSAGFSRGGSGLATTTGSYNKLCDVRVQGYTFRSWEQTFIAPTSGAPTTSLAASSFTYVNGAYPANLAGVNCHTVGDVRLGSGEADSKLIPAYVDYEETESVVTIPFQTATSPFAWANNHFGKVNANSYELGGTTFTAGQLRFMGCAFSVTQTDTSTYLFDAVAVYKMRKNDFGFSEQRWEVDAGQTSKFAAVGIMPYKAYTFINPTFT